MAYFEDDNSNINDAYLAAQGGQVDQLGELFGQYAYDPSYYDFSQYGTGDTGISAGDLAPDNGGYVGPDQSWYDSWDGGAGSPDLSSDQYYGQAESARDAALMGQFDLYGSSNAPEWAGSGDPAPMLAEAPPVPGRFDPMRLGPNEPTRTGVAMPEPKITSSGKLRTWDTKTGREIGQVGGGNRGGGGDMAGMIQGYNDAVARARNAAAADRNQALQAVAQWRQLIEQRLAKNPFGAEYKAQTLGVVRDARARQYSAAVEELRQAYAQQGKPLDPRLLTMLRMQMSREENGDLRSLSIDTAGKAYAADTSYVNEVGQTVSALDRILSNTSRQPNPQELAFLMSLSRSGGN